MSKKRKFYQVDPVKCPMTFYLLNCGGVITEMVECGILPGEQPLPGFNNAGNFIGTAQAGDWRSLLGSAQGGTI